MDRAIGLDIDVRHKDKTLMIDLQSPWKKVNVRGMDLAWNDISRVVRKPVFGVFSPCPTQPGCMATEDG